MLILYGLLAIGISFLCSLLEASLLSLPRSHVEMMAETGSRAGKLLSKMKKDIDRPLAAILTLNTIAHTAGAAGVGAQAAVVFGSHTVGIASAVMTLLILVFSEIIPKTLGVMYNKRLSAPMAYTVQLMIWICYPIIIVLEWVNRAIGQREEEVMTRGELAAAIRLGQQAGALEQREFRIFNNLLALTRIRVADILTPRTVVFSLPEEMTVGEAIERHPSVRFARIPVFRESMDDVTGYVTRFKIYESSSTDPETPLKKLIQPLDVVPEQATVADALELALERQKHILLVVDEYGGTAGIVTLEDMMETLLGTEIIDESDLVVDMQELAKRLHRRRERS